MEEMTSRQRQAIETKKHILNTSLKLIEAQGYDAVTIKQICEEAEVSTGAFYHHLKSKEGILIEGYSQCDDYFDEYIINNLKSSDFVDKILEYIGAQMEYAEMLGVDIITQVYKAQLTEAGKFILSDVRGLPSNLSKLIHEAQKQGLVRTDYEAHKISDELLLISRGVIYNWSQNNANFDLTKRCREIISRHLDYFLEKKDKK